MSGSSSTSGPLVGLDTAAANGKHGGRLSVVDGDMLAIALRRRDAEESVTAIAAHLGVGYGRDTGQLTMGLWRGPGSLAVLGEDAVDGCDRGTLALALVLGNDQ